MNYAYEMRKVITRTRNEIGSHFKIERIIRGTEILFESFGLSSRDYKSMLNEWSEGHFKLTSEDITTTLSFRNRSIDLFSYVVTEA